MSRFATSLSLSALLFSAGPAARADVIPADEAACQGKAAGDGCTIDMGGGSGTCRSAKCGRIDYAHWDRDASVAPPFVEVDCLKCVVGDAGVASAAPDLAQAGGGGGGGGGGSCSAARSPLVRTTGPWVLAGLFSLLLVGRRRRR